MALFNKYLRRITSNEFYIVIGLIVSSILLAIAISLMGITAGIVGIGIIISIPIVLLFITNPRFGYYSLLVLSFFIAYINRWTYGKIPFLVLEIIILIVIIGLVVNEIRTRKKQSNTSSLLRNPIAIILIIWTLYLHLQLFNPNGASIAGKIITIRQGWYGLLSFVLTLYIFESFNQVKIFLKIILTLSFIAAIFGLTQKYIGLLPFEKVWLFSSPERINLFVIGGQIRTWSFLNDPSNFGLLMASSSITCIILITGPFKASKKIALGIGGSLMLLAMVSSGTRTAFIMVVIGLIIFGLMTINNLKTIIACISLFIVFIVIYFGPFYSAPIIRIRTAFQGTEDPSMNVRAINKKRIQPYILSHPFGCGPNTTGEIGKVLAPNNPLAGFPPDSGYLKIALELGYIGLFIIILLNYKTSEQAVTEFFKSNDPEKKTIYAAILSSLISLCTADLTQLAISMKPFDLIFISYFAIIIRTKDYNL